MPEKKEVQVIKFEGYDLFLKTFASNKDRFRVEIETGLDQYEVIKQIPSLPKGVYDVYITLKADQVIDEPF